VVLQKVRHECAVLKARDLGSTRHRYAEFLAEMQSFYVVCFTESGTKGPTGDVGTPPGPAAKLTSGQADTSHHGAFEVCDLIPSRNLGEI
jgi:hypothetical protein